MIVNSDEKYYKVTPRNSLAYNLMIKARANIYKDFLAKCNPKPSDKIIDVGISDVVNDAANLLERNYPYHQNLTAVGLGKAEDFCCKFPEINYQQITPGKPLPFSGQQFDIAFSNAVLEHVGSQHLQRFFIEDLLRISRKVFIVVPNRYFLIEHHTGIPLLHWLDVTHTVSCHLIGETEWASKENLILISRRHLLDLCPFPNQSTCGYTGLNLGPFSSNLYLLIEH